MAKGRYDVIIVGASFAGLAVAAQLRGKRVLLLDPKPIGTGQTSACGTLVHTMQALGAEDAIRQIHDRLVLHMPGRTYVFPAAEPFCTFDYGRFCHLLAERAEADFLRASAHGLDGTTVQTSRGEFQAEVIVDASGWRTALGRTMMRDLGRGEALSFGIETTAEYSDGGLHFYYDPEELLPMGIGWAFPVGSKAHIGVASYQGSTRLRGRLEKFLSSLGALEDGLHGGYLPYRLRRLSSGRLFLVGDAAGQCLALTGEGIRPALFYGTHLGQLVDRMIDGDLSLEATRIAYQRLVDARRLGHNVLYLAQRVLPRLPLPTLHALFQIVSRPDVQRRLIGCYIRAFRLTLDVAQPKAGRLLGDARA